MKHAAALALAFFASLLVHAGCLVALLLMPGVKNTTHPGSERYQESRSVMLTLRSATLSPAPSFTSPKQRLRSTPVPLPTPEKSLKGVVSYEERQASQAEKEGIKHYYPPTELSRRPQLYDAFNIEPELLFTDTPGEGTLTLKLFLNEEGGVDGIVIEVSSLPKDIEQRLLRTFQRIKYNAGEKNGERVASWVRYEIRLLPPEVLPNSLP